MALAPIRRRGFIMARARRRVNRSIDRASAEAKEQANTLIDAGQVVRRDVRKTVNRAERKTGKRLEETGKVVTKAGRRIQRAA